MKHGFGGIAAALVVALAGTVSGAAAQLPEGVTAEMVEQGEEIFGGAGICAACHGAGGIGLIGPNLTDEEWLHGDGSFEFLVDLITKGVAAGESKGSTPGMMPPKGGSSITEEQVRAVAAYVLTLSHEGG